MSTHPPNKELGAAKDEDAARDPVGSDRPGKSPKSPPTGDQAPFDDDCGDGRGGGSS